MVTKTKEVKSSRVAKNLKKEVSRMKRQTLNKIKKVEQAVAYCRVCSDGTIKPSLIFQEKEILKYSKNHYLQLAKNYKCVESSWNIKGREKIKDMLKYITKHPEIKHIIFYSEEIINSNLLDTQRIYDFVRQNNKTIHFVKDSNFGTSGFQCL